MRFQNILGLLVIMGALNGCAYFIDKEVQPITVETIAANNAECLVIVDGLKHKVNPPETINIGNSYNDLEIECIAPGNRTQSVVIPSRIQKSTYYNVFNGVVPGALWDGASGAMFAYPDKVIVDFTGVEPSMNGLPAHNSEDIIQPEDHNLEEFLPGTPRLNRDKNAAPVVIRERQRNASAPTTFTYIETGADPQGKGGSE